MVQYLKKRSLEKLCFIILMRLSLSDIELIRKKQRDSESFLLRDNESYCGRYYLDEKQIRQLERAVTGYFDYIEDLIERENVFTMEEFEKSVNAFLEFRQYKILKDNGRISHKQALDKAYGEYEIFNKSQPIESDFDKMIKKVMGENQG